MAENLIFDKSMSRIEILFRLSGISISINKDKPPNTKKNLFIYIFNFITLNTDVLGGIFWFLRALRIGRRLTDLTYLGPCITVSSLGDVKSICLVPYTKNIYQLIDKMRNLEIKENSRGRTDEKDKIIQKEIYFYNLVVNVLYVINALLLIGFAVHPVISMGLKYMKTNELEFLLPFMIIYPFDPYNIKVWPIVYVRQIWSEIVVILFVCAADFLFYTFCTHITVQFKLLRHHIEKSIEAPKHPNQRIGYDEAFRTKFVEIIKWHQELIWATNMMETIYTKSNLYNFVTSSIIICLTGFNVTTFNDIAPVITFVTFLFMGLSQIFFLCFFGDMLMKASTEISDAIYNCNWYLAHPKIGKHLLLILTRAQKPCKLTAFGFADVNLRAFMKILSTSWSYFALLETLYG